MAPAEQAAPLPVARAFRPPIVGPEIGVRETPSVSFGDLVRMLAEARNRNEVKIVIESDLSEIVRLERTLEKTFGLQQALVVTQIAVSVVLAAVGAPFFDQMTLPLWLTVLVISRDVVIVDTDEHGDYLVRGSVSGDGATPAATPAT